MNHHLGQQTQTWEEAEHKERPQYSTQGWEERIQAVWNYHTAPQNLMADQQVPWASG